MTTAIQKLSAPWSEEPAENPGRARIRARIGGLHCSLCTGTVEKALGRRKGVDKVSVSLTHEQALVEYDPQIAEPGDLLQTLKDIGYSIHDPNKLRPFEEEERELVTEGRRFLTATVFSLLSIALITEPASAFSWLLPVLATASLVGFVFLVLRSRGLWWAISGSASLGVVTLGLLSLKSAGALGGTTPWIVGGLAATLIFGIARHILVMSVQAIRRGILNQHVLLEAGAFAGLAGGVIGLFLNSPGYPTAPFFAVTVMVATYHIFSEWLSLIVKTRSSQAVKRLLDLQPETARVRRAGRDIDMPIDEVVEGDLVRIRPGERLPLDGEVVEGRSAVDQSLVTGEPMPVERGIGDQVIGGTVNGNGTLLVRVTAVGKESFLHRVVREVEDARALKPGLLHLVDRVLSVYTPSVLTISVLSFLGWALLPQLLGFEADLQRAVFAGLSVLVMGYPCAVGISAPLSIVRGAGVAAEKGILMRTGEAFQGYRLVRQIAFDKTGTLTEGHPRVHEVEALNGDRDALLTLAAAAEAASEHPLGEAIVEAAFEAGLTPPDTDDFQATPGKGVIARIDEQDILVGSPRFLAEHNIDLKPIDDRISTLEGMGRTVITVARDGRLEGFLSFGDALRDGAAETIEKLRTSGIRTILITGDNTLTASRVAGELGLDEVHAGVLPGEKASLIRDLQERGRTAMVGDGINDAPALMQADVGVAMGSGTDIAIDAADIIILNNQISNVSEAREISRTGYRKMLQNVSLAFLFNGIGVPVAATGLLYPVWAMIAMAASVTAIFINSLRGQPHLFFNAILSVGQPEHQSGKLKA
ncbi:cation-translocating P-type ATPase [Henriciella sp.]|uniref:heavy metal translocating P-type ATPase n=1 Tax=Henriciella sp. TaxID=1968823 RepID=UPI002605BD34|nr:cation-translocating P-type ATPase [Henriciella sp.]